MKRVGFVLLSFLAGCAAAPPKLGTLPALQNLATPQSDVVATGAIQTADVAALRDAGVKHVIDLRADAETPDFDEASSVRDAGLGYDNLPIAGAQSLTLENVRVFDRLLAEAARPVLVHCASGNRVGALAALRAGWLQGEPLEAAIEEGRRWGLKGLEPVVRERLAQAPQ